MNRKLRVVCTVSVILVASLLAGYVLTVWSIFPTAHMNAIFAVAPVDTPYGKDPLVTSAHLMLVHDMNLLHQHSWRYRLVLSDAQGKKVGVREFSTEEVGGRCSLEHNASLVWDEDAGSVTARILDFSYRYEVPQTSAVG